MTDSHEPTRLDHCQFASVSEIRSIDDLPLRYRTLTWRSDPLMLEIVVAVGEDWREALAAAARDEVGEHVSSLTESDVTFTGIYGNDDIYGNDGPAGDPPC